MIRLTRFRVILLLAVAASTTFVFPRVQDFVIMETCLDNGGVYTHSQCAHGNEGELAWIDPKRKLLQSLAAALLTVVLALGIFAIWDYRHRRDRSAAR